MTYTLAASPSLVIRDVDQAHIPNNPGNKDWQAYQHWLSAGNTPNPYVPPTLTKAQEADAHLAGGLTITSTSNPSLNGTFNVTTPDNLNVNAIITSLANGTGLPLGLDQVPVFDKSGAQHMFERDEIVRFSVAFRDFVHNTRLYGQGQADSLPPNSVALDALDAGSGGTPGRQGPKGDPGPQGPKGDTGAAGATGPKGDPGATGPQGAVGPTGQTGAKGATGAVGPPGPTAVSANAHYQATLGTDSFLYVAPPPIYPAVSVYQTATQAITRNTATKILFDTKEFDTTNAFEYCERQIQSKR